MAEPDNRRNKGGHDSYFCKGPHNAGYPSSYAQVYCAADCAGLEPAFGASGAKVKMF